MEAQAIKMGQKG